MRVDAQELGDVDVIGQRGRKADDSNHSLRTFNHAKSASHLAKLF